MYARAEMSTHIPNKTMDVINIIASARELFTDSYSHYANLVLSSFSKHPSKIRFYFYLFTLLQTVSRPTWPTDTRAKYIDNGVCDSVIPTDNYDF